MSATKFSRKCDDNAKSLRKLNYKRKLKEIKSSMEDEGVEIESLTDYCDLEDLEIEYNMNFIEGDFDDLDDFFNFVKSELDIL